MTGRPRNTERSPLTERLRADCEHCFGLCSVVPALTASSDFAIDKDAGQQVAQVTFGGRDWRQAPGTAQDMFSVFTVMRQLHELLWYLAEARALPAAGPVHDQLDQALDEVGHLTGSEADALIGLDTGTLRGDVSHLLRQASELARGPGRPETELAGADLIGKDLGRADLQAACLRNACLIGASLQGADLRTADVLGADFRGADLSGADLSTSVFLIQSQVDAARGDAATRLPPALRRPGHWTAARAGRGGAAARRSRR